MDNIKIYSLSDIKKDIKLRDVLKRECETASKAFTEEMAYVYSLIRHYYPDMEDIPALYEAINIIYYKKNYSFVTMEAIDIKYRSSINSPGHLFIEHFHRASQLHLPDTILDLEFYNKLIELEKIIDSTQYKYINLIKQFVISFLSIKIITKENIDLIIKYFQISFKNEEEMMNQLLLIYKEIK